MYTTLRRRRGISMVEVVISAAIISGLLVTALTTVSAARLTTTQTDLVNRGSLLAEQLVAEILSRAYEDPDTASPTLGTNGAESASANRSGYDDVDDFNGWSAKPPQWPNGTTIDEFAGWQRSATITYVTAADLVTDAGADNGVKRIDVEVEFNGQLIVQLTAFRTRAGWEAYVED